MKSKEFKYIMANSVAILNIGIETIPSQNNRPQLLNFIN